MRTIALIAAASLCATLANAEEKRDLGAHEHGVGALNIAFEDGEVAMEFTAPGADIVGFEHPAESAADRAKVDDAIAILAKPLALFRLPEAAKCTLVAASVELHGEDEEHEEKHGHKDDHDDKHDHEEKHADKDDHDDKHGHKDDHAEHEEESHTEFHAEYRLACAAPDAIDRITFSYFETFPNAKELEVQMISAKGTNGFEVERDDPVLDLRGLI